MDEKLLVAGTGCTGIAFLCVAAGYDRLGIGLVLIGAVCLALVWRGR